MVLNILIDILLGASMLIGVVIGVKNGFIKTSSKPLRVILTLFCTLNLASSVGQAVIKPIVSDSVSGGLSAYLYSHIEELSEGGSVRLPSVLKMAVGLLGERADDIVSGESTYEVVENIVYSLSDPLVNLLSFGIAFLLLYFVFKMAFTILVAMINDIFDRGVIGIANKILGGVLTAAITFSLIWGCVCLFEFVIRLSIFEDGSIFDGFQGGVIYRFFKSFNPLDVILSF